LRGANEDAILIARLGSILNCQSQAADFGESITRADPLAVVPDFLYQSEVSGRQGVPQFDDVCAPPG
jgi:hypothetical protein